METLIRVNTVKPFIIENTGILSETAILIMQKTTILIMQQNKRENISLLGKYKLIGKI